MAASSTKIPQDPSTWTLEHAKAALGVADAEAQKLAAASKLYLEGKHVQLDDWMGQGRDAAGSLSESTKTNIGKSLAGAPETARCVGRRVDGSCGNQADISVQPNEPADIDPKTKEAVASAGQKAFGAQWKRDVGEWWDRVGFWGGKDLRRPDGVRGLVVLGSSHPSGAACLRWWFNSASRTQATNDGAKRIPKQADRAAALRHIEFAAYGSDTCAVYVDPDTHQSTGVFSFKDAEDRECAEVWFAERDKTVRHELVAGQEEPQVTRFPWGGRLPISEARVGCLLTDIVIRLQRSLDAAITGGNRLARAHAHAQRTHINPDWSGDWQTTPPASGSSPVAPRIVDGVAWYLHETPPEMGNSVISTLIGFPFTTSRDVDGKTTEGITTPQVHYHEPSPLSNTIEWADALLMWLRGACHQAHIRTGLHGSNAEMSGEAYEQARAEFEADIKAVAEALDNTIMAFLTSLTIGADWLTLEGDATPKFADEYHAVAQSHPSAGPPSVESQRLAIAQVEAEIISPDEATARAGIQEVQGERDRIRAARTLSVQVERANLVKILRDGGADPVGAYEVAGFSPEEARKLARSDGIDFGDEQAAA